VHAAMRRRRHRDPRRALFGVTIILLQAALAVGVVWYLFSHEYFQLPFFAPSHYVLHAEFSDASGLNGAYHSPVTVAGVPLGRVTSVSYRDGLAVATLELPTSVEGKVFADARARIIPRSVLADLMVDITPGSRAAGPLRSGAVIPAARTSSTVGLDKLIDTLDPDTRAEVQVLLGQLSIGLHGRAAALRAGLAELGRVVNVATGVTGQLAERRVLLSRLVSELDALTTELGDHDRDLAEAIDAGQRTLQVTSAQSAQVAGTVRQLPSTLGNLAGAMSAITRLAPPIDSALVGLRPFATRLPGALRALRSFIPTGTGLVHDLNTFTAGAAQPVSDLRGALTALDPTASGLRSPIADLFKILTPINNDRAGIGEVGDNFSGVFSTNDVNGPILRGLGFFENFNPADMGFGANASGAELAKAKAETVLALTQVCLHINPVACLVRYLVPGLPGAVVPLLSTVSSAARLSRTHATRLSATSLPMRLSATSLRMRLSATFPAGR
jgi:phospholipid/cholesterol/gamma-HCH transport system substrate-binding protein